MKSGSGIILFVFFLLIFFSFGCSYKGQLATQNLAGMYKTDQQLSGLNYSIFNHNDSIGFLFYRFQIENLKSKKISGRASFTAYKLQYLVFDGYKKGILVDSGSRVGIDSVLFSGFLYDSLRFKAATGKNYIIQVNFTDLNAQLTFSQLIDLPKARPGLSADYLLTDASDRPLFRNYISRAENVCARTRFRTDTVLSLSQYKLPERKAAKSPYSFSQEEKPEEIYPENEIKISIHGNFSEPFKLIDEGVYMSGPANERLKIFRFYDGFPKIGSASTMREALRYISTDQEYQEMMALPAKAAVDNFWINLAGNSERALTQIKRYYSRVESTNELFSISGEGWMSDRGMVFIVFGPPNIVYRNAEVEEWTYGEPGNALSVRFYFHPFQSSLGIQDYKLIRLEEYKRPWNLAVSNWRR